MRSIKPWTCSASAIGAAAALPEAGFDCSGFVSHVFREGLGLVLPRSSREMSKTGEVMHRDELKPGDLVFFNTMRNAFSHVGIYLGRQPVRARAAQRRPGPHRGPARRLLDKALQRRTARQSRTDSEFAQAVKPASSWLYFGLPLRMLLNTIPRSNSLWTQSRP
jgi:hypothetical protein